MEFLFVVSNIQWNLDYPKGLGPRPFRITDLGIVSSIYVCVCVCVYIYSDNIYRSLCTIWEYSLNITFFVYYHKHHVYYQYYSCFSLL